MATEHHPVAYYEVRQILDSANRMESNLAQIIDSLEHCHGYTSIFTKISDLTNIHGEGTRLAAIMI